MRKVIIMFVRTCVFMQVDPLKNSYKWGEQLW